MKYIAGQICSGTFRPKKTYQLSSVHLINLGLEMQTLGIASNFFGNVLSIAGLRAVKDQHRPAWQVSHHGRLGTGDFGDHVVEPILKRGTCCLRKADGRFYLDLLVL